MRLIFCHPRVRAAQFDWESVARSVVAVFRADAARTGATEKVRALVDELCRLSSEFEAMRRDNDVRLPPEVMSMIGLFIGPCGRSRQIVSSEERPLCGATAQAAFGPL